MSVLLIAIIGFAIVLASILVLRLHPLIALLIASLFLLAATPATIQFENQFTDSAHRIAQVSENRLLGFEGKPEESEYCTWPEDEIPDTDQRFRLVPATMDQVQDLPPEFSWYAAKNVNQDKSILPGFSKGQRLVAADSIATWQQQRWSGLGGRLADGFAKTFRKLAIPVTMAAIVGICLLESGAAGRLVAAIMRLFGRGGTGPALTLSGFTLGIPVYFDNVFYLLLPLAKAAGRARPESYLTAVMSIIVGATMAHSLVPPTPGPLFVAGEIGVSVGMMMIGGFVVGGIAALGGFSYGILCQRWIQLAPDAAPEVDARPDSRPMPLWIALLPIALPIIILGGSEIVAFLHESQPANLRLSHLHQFVLPLNDPGLIFIFTALFAIGLLRWYADHKSVGKAVAQGLSDAGVIVLLTSAGGAFGASLQQLQIADKIAEQFTGLASPWAMLVTAFVLTTIIRAAQGSATVAMLTSAAIVSPVMQTIELPFHPLYVALAIGCGSKPLPWMNDSGFWQVATMTGMNTSQTLRTFSAALTIMGTVGFAATLLGAWLLPLT